MLHTRICDLLGIEHPIISAPMAGAADAELAAAVSAADGFGLIGGSGGGPDWLRMQIRAVRERTDRVLRNGFTNTWHGRDDEVVARRAGLGEQIMAAMQASDKRIAPARAGAAAGLIHAVEPASEIVRRIAEQAERLLRERPGQVLS